MKLNEKDFEVLDGLLSKIGFGSYYDCIQLLKDAIYDLEPKLQCKLEKETDLLVIVGLVNRIASKYKKTGEFTGLIPSESVGRIPIPREDLVSFSQLDDIKDDGIKDRELRD